MFLSPFEAGGLVAPLLLGDDFFRHIDGGDQRRLQSSEGKVEACDVDIEDRAIGPFMPAQTDFRQTALMRKKVRGREPPSVLGRQQIADRHRRELGTRVAVLGSCGIVRLDDAHAILLVDEHRDRVAFENIAEGRVDGRPPVDASRLR